ncbi:UNVERIFIED_CONTAM: hypothetical protein K2H54_058107 [Gekko kuhli]
MDVYCNIKSNKFNFKNHKLSNHLVGNTGLADSKELVFPFSSWHGIFVSKLVSHHSSHSLYDCPFPIYPLQNINMSADSKAEIGRKLVQHDTTKEFKVTRSAMLLPFLLAVLLERINKEDTTSK